MNGPPEALCAALNRAKYYCPDCAGSSARIEWDSGRGRWRWRVSIWHAPTCPVPKSAKMRRALDRSLMDIIGATCHLADYCEDDVIGQHRVSRYPSR